MYRENLKGLLKLRHFHLKFARNYPLLALKLPENRVVFKTSKKKKGKKKHAVV